MQKIHYSCLDVKQFGQNRAALMHIDKEVSQFILNLMDHEYQNKNQLKRILSDEKKIIFNLSKEFEFANNEFTFITNFSQFCNGFKVFQQLLHYKSIVNQQYNIDRVNQDKNFYEYVRQYIGEITFSKDLCNPKNNWSETSLFHK